MPPGSPLVGLLAPACRGRPALPRPAANVLRPRCVRQRPAVGIALLRCLRPVLSGRPAPAVSSHPCDCRRFQRPDAPASCLRSLWLHTASDGEAMPVAACRSSNIEAPCVSPRRATSVADDDRSGGRPAAVRWTTARTSPGPISRRRAASRPLHRDQRAGVGSLASSPWRAPLKKRALSHEKPRRVA